MKYIYLICPFYALILSTMIKNLIEMLKDKKLDISRILNGSGGMPSCHTAFASSLTTLIGFKNGFDSPIFALALVFLFITSYDAFNIRYESGLHASILNSMDKSRKLKEKIGHTKLEVMMGFVVGIIVGYIFSKI